MKVLFDTSVIVAALIKSHPKHEECISWLQRAKTKKIELDVAAHTIAETYAVLTRLPLSPRLLPKDAQFLIKENIEKSAKIISLSASDYTHIVDTCAELQLSGGVIYDAIIFYASLKAKASKVVTLNQNDFKRVAPKHTKLFVTP